MPVRIITADERLSAAHNKTSIAIFGPPGAGKTSLLKTLPADQTVCLDLEAGMKSVQDWPGASIPVRSFVDFRDLAVLIGGPDPAADPNAWYSAQHHQHTRGVYAGSGVDEFLASQSVVFVDSITEAVQPDPINAKPRKAQNGGTQNAPAWQPNPPPNGTVPWANQDQPTPPQPAPATGPAWLNT